MPLNGSIFTLKEAFAIMKEHKYKVATFYDRATNEGKHDKHPQLLMNKSSWYRRWNRYCNDGIIPADNAYGIARGQPPIIKNNDLVLLNDDLYNNVGAAEDEMELTDKIISVKENEMIKKGEFPQLKNLLHRLFNFIKH